MLKNKYKDILLYLFIYYSIYNNDIVKNNY